MLTFSSRDDLEKLIPDRIQESLTLEYKSSPALNRTNDGRSELVKDVTALANSAGGQIIYGMKEREGYPTEVDGGVDPKQFTPEWIEQVVTTNTSPRLQSLNIEAISLGDEKGYVAYIINVPQSEVFAPHQNTIDNKYYRRFERRAVPMADYEIRDIMRRNQKATIEIKYLFDDGMAQLNLDPGQYQFTVCPYVSNVSPEPSLYSLIKLYIDDRIIVRDVPGGVKELAKQTAMYGRTFNGYEARLMIPKDFPLVKGTSITFNPEDFVLRLPSVMPDINDSLILAYQAIASPGSVTSGFQSIILVDNKLIIAEHVLVLRDGVSMLY